MERKRILAVDHTGGVAAFRRKYELIAADPDIDLTVLVPERWVENGRTIEAPREAPGYRVLSGKVIWPGRENRALFVTGLAAAIARTRPDVLHLYEEPFSLIALQSVLLSRLLSPRARISFYSFDILAEGFHYAYRPGWFYGLVQRLVHRFADAGMSCCGLGGRVLRSRGFRGPIRYAPMAVDPERYRPPGPDRESERARRDLRGFVVGFVGRLLPIKGLDDLVRAAAKLDGEWTLLVVGSGPEEATLREDVRRRGLEDRLRLVGGVPHDEVPGLLSLMDVLVLPSVTTRHSREQFGRVLIEAMSCEVPVVGSDCGGIPEVIGEAGIVVPERDPEALGAALRALSQSPAERRRLGVAGRRRVLDHFTWEAVAADWLAVWKGLSAGRLPSQPAPPWAVVPPGGTPGTAPSAGPGGGVLASR
jgi:glycosyltransferase involved in cell wall biosynthesis